MAYNSIINRDTPPALDPLVPTPVSAQVIKEVAQSSAVTQRARTVRMSTKTFRQPVLSALPEAYWVSGDTGLKQTSNADWENLELVAEELAVIVPIPDAYLSDSQVPIWDEVRPLLVEAFGRAVDSAILFGLNKPVTWTSDAIVPGAVDAGNVVEQDNPASVTHDLADNIAELAENLATQGYSFNGLVSRPGLRWSLARLRDENGVPIYTPALPGGVPATVYGEPYTDVLNGSWDADEATLVGGDWTKAIVGLRQDLTFKMFTEGVISDGSGNVVLNLMQQDSVALRCVMRCAYTLANPVSPLTATRFPFGVVTPYGAGS